MLLLRGGVKRRYTIRYKVAFLVYNAADRVRCAFQSNPRMECTSSTIHPGIFHVSTTHTPSYRLSIYVKCFCMEKVSACYNDAFLRDNG